MHPARIFFRILAGSILVFLLFFVTFYFITKGDYPVVETLDTDPSLSNIEINNKKLFVAEFGSLSQSTIIFVHGGPGLDHNYLLPLHTLSDSFHLVFYDQAGCGLSPRYPDPQLSFQEGVADLSSLIRHYANHKPVYLVGHSYGSQLALAALNETDSLVKNLILLEPEFLTQEAFTRFMQKTNYMRPGFTWPMLKHMLTHWFQSLHINEPDKHANQDYFYGKYATSYFIKGHPLAGYLCGESENPITLKRYGSVASAALFRSLISTKGELAVDFITPTVSSKGDRVLFVASACNSISGPDIQLLHQMAIPGSEIEVIEDAGFNPLFYQLGKVEQIIRDFLDKAERVD